MDTKKLQHTKSSPALANLLKSVMTRSAPSSPSTENKSSQRLHDDIQKLQNDQIQIIRKIEQLKQEGAKSDVIKDMEANEKIISGELTRKREKLLKQYKKLKYKTVKEKGSAATLDSKSKITKSNSANDTYPRDEDEDDENLPKSFEKENWMKIVKLKKGKSLSTIHSKEIVEQIVETEDNEVSNSGEKRFRSVDIGFLSIYDDPSKSKEKSESDPFSLLDEEANQLSSKLLTMLREDSSKKFLIKDFGVKSDINEKGLARGHKEKVETANNNGTKKKGFQMEDENLCSYPFNSNIDMALFAVFDGHAGSSAAKAAKQMFPQEFATQLKMEKQKLVDAKIVFEKTFSKLDANLTAFEYEGTTASIVFIWSEGGDRYLQAANVGDSSAFLCRGEDAIPLTVDHKLTNPDEQVRVRNMGIEVNMGQTRVNGLSVSRSLGDSFLKKEKTGVIADPYVSIPYKLTPQDTAVIIASDGLWDVISGKRAAEIIKDEESAQVMARKLLATVLSSPKCQDNVTVVVVIL